MLQVIRRLPPKAPLCHVNHIIKSNFLWFPEPKEKAVLPAGVRRGKWVWQRKGSISKQIDRLISIFRIVNGGTTCRIRNAHESRNNPLKWFAIHSPWMLNAFMPHAITLLATNDEYVYRYTYTYRWLLYLNLNIKTGLQLHPKPVVGGCGRMNQQFCCVK